jgi:plastocyanin
MRKISGLLGALILVLTTVSCGGSDKMIDVVPPPPCPTNTFCLTISNTFSPAVMTVAAGTTVSWRNDAGTIHNVTWDAAAGAAAALAGDGAGNIDTWDTGSHTRLFNTPGTYPFHCTIHAGMNGSLTVQ